jgi:RHS repeat-associated protein
MKEQKGHTEKQKSLSTEQTTQHTQSSTNAPHNESAPGGGKQSFITLPKGGGAIHGMGEKFEANPVTGTGSFSVPLTISPGRENFTPQLALAYDSGSGNSPFGLGWNVGMPAITRKTDKGIPQYFDNFSQESDTFILSGAEDLVHVLNETTGLPVTRTEGNYSIYSYRPRTEGLFALIERHYNYITGISHWRSISKENITTIYGASSGTRICDPDDETKIFSWLIEKSWDAKGNLMEFEYKKEDATGIADANTGFIEIYEKNRMSSQKCFNNLYLKQVKYGNTVMYNPTNSNYTTDWHFNLVFDYGEHATDNLIPDQDWTCRPDSYSSFRAGFEIRTYRLCKRVLMFHKFVNDLGSSPVLVKSTDLEYLQNEYLTLLQSIKHKSYNNNDTAGMPPLTFNYSEAIMGSIRNVSKECLQKLPSGIDGSNYQWADLYSEGISGILKQDNHAWYFIPNYGDKTYYEATPMGVNPEPELVLGDVKSEVQKPAAIRNKRSTYHLGDVDSDGLPELIINAPGINGYYSRDDHQKWEPFKTFAHTPNINLGDPNVKLVDLTGDGLADIIISKGSHFEIYFSEGKEGYSNYRRVVCGTNEENGPVVVFSDAAHRIFLSDMSGDGMVDIVKISNGSISYWPNMGYGRFGEMVSMKNAPHFDRPDLFNPSQLRLADVDGTGSTDIIYLGSTGTKYFKNKAGNGWSEAVDIPYYPLTAKSSNTEVADLFGNGTSCLLWNTALPGKVQRMQYIELTSGIKPYLLTQIDNGMGGLTEMQYAPSTKFYLRDKLSGKPWITRLPFPVHVLEKVIITDKVAGNVFVNSYAYHHGYYDNAEREFRGFGMVEQWDTEQYNAMEAAGYNLENENINQESHVAPVYTKTWFHTGFFKNRAEISSHYLSEYFNGDTQAWLLPDTVLPDGLTALESREACRALRGTALRKEIYAKDGTASENIPYTVEEKSYNIRLLQQKGNNKYAVFHVTESETLAYHYERNSSDPRIAHTLVLDTDEYGNILKSAQIAYPRRTVPQDMPEQGELHILCTENNFINQLTDSVHLIGVNYQTRAYEITGIAYNNTKFEAVALLAAINNASEIDFSALPSGGVQKRKIQHDRISFWDTTASYQLSLGDIAPQALVYQKQSLELTQDLIDLVNDQDTKITSQILTNEGVYLNENNLWWVVSDIQSFNNGAFYQPYIVTDPFGNSTTLEYDSYQLLISSITDALYNTTYVANNYRLLQPWEITDPNQNMQMVEFDTLGMVAKMALAGKNGEGDTLNDPTIIYEYDLHNWINNLLPVYSHVSSRETHYSNNATTNYLESYTYTSGLGQEIQTKVQAEDGLAWIIGANGKEQVNSSNRWTATGRTILNNKGKVVKQYEPWFSTTYEYEPETELTQYGVSPVMHYDPLLRNIRTDFPDGSFAKVEFTPWQQKSYDQNDTVAESQWYADSNSPDPNEPEPSNSKERAAWLSAKHYNTPQTQYFDSLGRVFIIEDDNGLDVNSNPLKYRVHNKLDISGRPLIVTDAKSREMTRHFYGFKQQLFTHNIDSGSRWMITDVAGKPLRIWDDMGRTFRFTYDQLQRPLNIYLTQNNVEILTEQKVYGTDYNRNNIGQLEFIYDQSGVTQIYEYDFKGNPLQSIKQYCEDYQNDIDWSQSPTLISESFTQLTQYDALNRPILLTQPDNSIIAYTYNKAALLETVTVNGNPYVTNINYNEKGQRERIYYGNTTRTRYYYDDKTFRLARLKTTRPDGNSGHDKLLDIYYTYDAVGNIVEQTDFAQQTHYFNNTVIEPKGKYQYDALYRLIQAQGRELSYLNMPDNNDFANSIPVPSDADMQNYTQHYTYDQLGNIQSLQNTGGSSWTRDYNYNIDNNYLLDHGNNENYTYDAHGNLLSMPHLSSMQWDFADRLKSATNGTFTSYYNYDSGGERSRKVVAKGNIVEMHFYIGGYEVFRKYVNGSLDTERQTLHIDDDNKKVALVDTLTIENGTPCSPSVVEVRYQYDNHLGSACLELDQNADVISYEEYHPFGTTSYRSGRTETEVSLKRYKYVGKERDEETGLYYYGARYYAAWLCRFVSVDPLQHEYPHYTPYQYAGNKPISYIDLDGLEPAKKPEFNFNYNDMVNQNNKRFSGRNNTRTPSLLPQKEAVKPPQQYSKLFNIDPKKLGNQAVVKPQNTTTTYYNKENYDQRQIEQKQTQFKKELQATDNFFYGETGQPIGSSGMLGSVKAGAEVYGLIEGGYGIIKLGQAVKKFTLLKAMGKMAKAETTVSKPVAEVVEVIERPELTGSIELDAANGGLTSFDDVAGYISNSGKLPLNFITKAEAKALGWNPKLGNLDAVAPGKSIGGDVFKNTEGLLPNASGRTWFEADINYSGGFRGNERLLYSNDDLIYKTTDHYKTFTQIK